jgi:hypothetical protein
MDINQISLQIQAAIQAHNWQYVAVLGLVAVVYLIRKYALKLPGKIGTFVNSDRGGSLLVLVSGIAMSWVTAIKNGAHFSWAVVFSGITTGILASGARNVIWDVWKPSDVASKVKLPPIPIVLIFFCLFSASCATAGGQAIKTCEVNSLPQTEQGAIACAAAAATGGGDVQSAITACAAGIVPSQFNCLIQGLVAWFKGRIPAHGQADPAYLAATQHLQVWLNSHSSSSCTQKEAEQLSCLFHHRFGYAMASR